MSDTKIQVPNSRMEQYLANVLSVLGGSEAVYDPGLPQSREEQYLTAILKLMKEKGNGGEVSGFETITVTDTDIDLDTQTFTLPKTPTDNFILNGVIGSVVMTKDMLGTGYQGYYFMAEGQSIIGYLINVTDTSGMYSIVSSAGIDAYKHLVNELDNYLTIASAESTYAKKTDLNAYAKTADLEKKIPNPPSTNGTYVYKATRTDSGVTFEWVLES